MIEATNLTKTYGAKTAVDDISFSVRPGMVTGFLGPNGAGKSTTMRLLGDWNWWLPGWLDRLLPNLDVEGGVGLPEPEYEPVDDGEDSGAWAPDPLPV